MSIATYNLTVRCTGGGEALPGATVEARLTRPDYTADGGNFPVSQRVTADENGIAVLALVSNLVGTQDSRYTVVVRTATGQFLDSREIQMPEADSTLAQLVEELPVNTDTQTAAAISAALAEEWATGTEPGGAGTQSSREWAGDAEAQAGNASGSATSASEDAALSQAWATGTEPGGVGTKSSREEAERAEAAAEVLPDPVGQGSGLVPRTKGDGTYILSPQSSRPSEFSEDAVFQYRFREANTVIEIVITGVTSVDVDWGDGTVDTVTSSGVVSHTYTAGGTYTVTLSGEFGGYDFYQRTGSEHLFRVKSFGINTDALEFRDSGIKSVPGVLPAGVTDMREMFRDTPFNQDIGSWDVSNVTDMFGTFLDTPFNQDIGSWDVSNVTRMDFMLQGTPFDQDISSWDVSSVTTMRGMFSDTPFNQDIGSWDVSNVVSMSEMFRDTSFNQDISSWDVSSVTDMVRMFQGTPFNQDISSWDVSSVTTMRVMFSDTPFNQDISSWDVSNVTRMDFMLRRTPFNQDISSWDVSSVTDMSSFLFDAQLSTANYDALLLAWSQLTLQLDVTAHFGSSTYSTDGTGDPLTDPAAARQKIIDDFGWTITDGGPA